MSYSFDLISSLPQQQVIDLIRLADPRYVSQGINFDRYSLIYIATQTGQLIPEDLAIFRNPEFQSLYFLSNQELLNRAKEILGPEFSSKSKIDLIRQIMSSSHVGNLPPEIFLDIASYVPTKERKRLAQAYKGTSIGEDLSIMSKTNYELIEGGNLDEIDRRIQTGRIYPIPKEIQIYASQIGNQEIINYLNMAKLNEVRNKLESDGIPEDTYEIEQIFKDAIETANIELAQYLYDLPDFRAKIIPIPEEFFNRMGVKSGDPRMIDFLIDKGFLDVRNYLDISLIMDYMTVPMFEYLVSKGVNPRDWRILDSAAEYRKFPVVEYMIRHGMNPRFIMKDLERHGDPNLLELAREFLRNDAALRAQQNANAQ